MGRQDALLRGIDFDMRVLEIAPRSHPVAPKAAEWSVVIADRHDSSDLRRFAIMQGIDSTPIEHVDYVWASGALHDVVPVQLHGFFDAAILQSIVTTEANPLALLRSISRLLKPGGLLNAEFIDKRQAQDRFRPVTTTGDLLDAYDRAGEQPGLKAMFHHFFDTLATVSSDGTPAFLHPAERAAEDVRLFSRQRQYSGGGLPRTLITTPVSIQLLLLDLRFLGLLDLVVREVVLSDGAAFWIQMQRGQGAKQTSSSSTFQARRLELLRQLSQEQAA
jgi:hypothetical protein